MRNFWMGVIVFGVIIISIWLQLNVFNNIPLFGTKANVGIVLVVALSTLCGQGVGISVGIVYGLLLDVLFGKAFGIYILLHFLIGYFCGKMSKGFSKENKTALVMITAVTTIVFDILSYTIFTFAFNYDIELFMIIKTIIVEVIYNVIIARILFNIFSSIAEMINKGKRSYYLL